MRISKPSSTRALLRNWRHIAPIAVLLSLVFPLAMPLGAAAQGIILPPPRCFDLPAPFPEPLPFPEPRSLPSASTLPSIAESSVLPQRVPSQISPPIQPVRPIVPPVRPVPIFPCWLTLRSHNVAVEIRDQIATTRVDQVFVNETGRDLEGSYIFPLPEDAIVTSFSMFVDGEQIMGEVLTREEARRIYDSIVRANRDPALLEFSGQGAFQARVFPVSAGGQRTLRLEYSQVLTGEASGDGGARLIRYVYPTATEKLSARPSQDTSFTVSLTTSQPLRSLYSPSHEVSVLRDGEHAATVTWSSKGAAAAGAPLTSRRAFELVVGVSPDPLGLSLLTSKPSGEDGYFLLLAAPSLQLGASAAIAKDVTLIFDTSGSMAGAKMEQAKSALRYLLNRLNPEDRFNMISFSSGVNPFESGMRPASERDRALTYVDGLVASGSTNINDALVTGFKLHAADSSGRPHMVLFVTDGLPTVGPSQPDQIIANVRRTVEGSAVRTRLFSFGVGVDVNTTLLDKISADFGGASSYVRASDNLEEAISTFYAKVASPVLTDLALDFGGASLYDVHPPQLPDLYAGSQLVLAGRYRTPGTMNVTLRGTAARSAQEFTLRNATFAAGPVRGQETLPRLWAGRKIAFLLSEVRLRGANKELVDEIVALATRHGIATPYTSIFVPEPTGSTPIRPGLPGLPSTLSAPGPQPTQAPLNTQQGRQQAADALRQGLESAPAAGAGAVQNSTDTNRLREAQSAQSASSSNVQSIADKTFLLVDGVWNDVSTGVDPPGPEARVRVPFLSDEYFVLLDRHPDAARYLSAGPRVLLFLDGAWYETVEG